MAYYMNLTEDVKTVKRRMKIGRDVAVTNKFTSQSYYGVVTGHKGNDLLLDCQGRPHTFGMDSGCWIFRYTEWFQ